MAHKREALQQGIRGATGERLRRCATVCYKRYMRKWMRERLARRKKGDGATPKEQAKAPAPLQPKYFDAAEASQPSEPEPQPEPEVPAAEVPADEAAPASGSDRPAQARPSRRRRGRGRRAAGGRPSRSAEAAPASVAEPPRAAEPIEAAPPAPAATAVPSTKGTVVLAIGLPGSGKSS